MSSCTCLLGPDGDMVKNIHSLGTKSGASCAQPQFWKSDLTESHSPQRIVQAQRLVIMPLFSRPCSGLAFYQLCHVSCFDLILCRVWADNWCWSVKSVSMVCHELTSRKRENVLQKLLYQYDISMIPKHVVVSLLIYLSSIPAYP